MTQKIYMNAKGAPISRQRADQLSNPEKNHARQAVAYAVKRHQMPPARTLTCTDCGQPAVEYDHYLGYAREHRLDVQPVCLACHGIRKRGRMTQCRRGHDYAQFGEIDKDGRRACSICRTRLNRSTRPRRHTEPTKHASIILRESDERAIRALIFIGFGHTTTGVVQAALQFAFAAKRSEIAGELLTIPTTTEQSASA